MARRVESFIAGPAIPTVVDHRLPAYFASDEALIDILDRYPHELFDINHCALDAEEQVSLATDAQGRTDGRTILEAIRAGTLWVNLRSCEAEHPGLWAEAMRSFGNLTPEIGAKGAGKFTGQLTISPPGARSPYHFVAAGVVMFHLRGVKRIWVYPATDAFLRQEDTENVIMRTATQDLPYQRIMDGAAYRFDIVPGQAVTWPLYAPHRVENPEGFCVSLALDYQTLASRITTGAHRANGVLRRRGWRIKPMTQTGWAHRALLWALSVVFARLGMLKTSKRNIARTLHVTDAGAKAKPKAMREQTAA